MALDVTVLDENGNEVQMSENIDYGDEDLAPIIEGEKAQVDEGESFKAAGFREASSVEELNDELMDMDLFGDVDDSSSMDSLDEDF